VPHVFTFVEPNFLTEEELIHFDAFEKDILGDLELFGDGIPVVGVGAEEGGPADPGPFGGGEVTIPEGSGGRAGRRGVGGGDHVRDLLSG
jgi:hypothetical protein